MATWMRFIPVRSFNRDNRKRCSRLPFAAVRAKSLLTVEGAADFQRMPDGIGGASKASSS